MLRSSTRLAGIPVLLVALFSAKLSFAESAQREPEPHRVDIGGRLHALTAYNVFGLGTSVDVGYRILPALSTGLSFHFAAGNHFSHDSCDFEGKCFESSYRLGAAVAVHPVQDYPLDPWFGLTAGPLYYYSGTTRIDVTQKDAYRSGWYFDLSLEAGLDVRFAGPFGVGVYLMTMPSLTDHQPWWNAFGLRASTSL